MHDWLVVKDGWQFKNKGNDEHKPKNLVFTTAMLSQADHGEAEDDEPCFAEPDDFPELETARKASRAEAAMEHDDGTGGGSGSSHQACDEHLAGHPPSSDGEGAADFTGEDGAAVVHDVPVYDGPLPSDEELAAVGLAINEKGEVVESNCFCLGCKKSWKKAGFAKHAAFGEKRLEQYPVS